MHRRSLRLILPALLMVPAALPAQNRRAVCWKPLPRESCAFIVLTNVGGYLVAGPVQQATGHNPLTGSPLGFETQTGIGPRALADWGFLANLTRRDAFGASVVASYDKVDHFKEHAYAGIYLRYRRWIGPRQSLDLAIGTPVLQNSDGRTSPYGLVKWNLNPMLGVALRPELRRSQTFDEHGLVNRSDFHLSAGVEVGEWPGLVTSMLGGGIAILALLLALSHSD